MVVKRILFLFLWAISRLPFRILYVFSDLSYFILTYLFSYRKKVILKNLALAFPGKSERERRNICKAFYRNFCDIIFETVKGLSISGSEMRQRVQMKNPGLFEELCRKKKGVMVVMGHFTNFEWTAQAFPLLVPQNCYAVYHPLKDRYFNEVIVGIRERMGLNLFGMHHTYPFMLHQPDPRPLYVFMADQSPHKGRIKYSTDFLGVNTPVHLGAAKTAIACDLEVVFIYTERVKRGKYMIHAEQMPRDPQAEGEETITDWHVAALEHQIRKQPAHWMWTHRRWKYAHPGK